MAEFEEKLNSILGDQNAMSQIMAFFTAGALRQGGPGDPTGQIGPSGQGGAGIHGADRRGGACITGISRATGAIPV